MIIRFIRKVKGGEFFIYSDTLKSRGDWLLLFSSIDRVVEIYQTNKEPATNITIEIDFEHPFPPPLPIDYPRPFYYKTEVEGSIKK